MKTRESSNCGAMRQTSATNAGMDQLVRQSPNSSTCQLIDWTAALVDNERWLRSVLRCRVSDAHVVEDLLQDIALAVFRQQAKPTDPEKVAPWLYRLAIRFAINFHRQTGRKRRLAQRINELGATGIYEPTEDALNWLLQSEQKKLVHQAMNQLRVQDREILMLKYTENWTYRQLADHLGASLNTIEYRLLRAKKSLRKLLTSTHVHKAVS